MTRLDVTSLLWGLIFAPVAATAIWYGLGNPLDWQLIGWGAPLALVVLGVLGLALDRPRHRARNGRKH